MGNYDIWYEGQYSLSGESGSIPSLASDRIVAPNDKTARATAEDLSKNFEKKLFNQIKSNHPTAKLMDLEFQVVIQSLKKDIPLKD